MHAYVVIGRLALHLPNLLRQAVHKQACAGVRSRRSPEGRRKVGALQRAARRFRVGLGVRGVTELAGQHAQLGHLHQLRRVVFARRLRVQDLRDRPAQLHQRERGRFVRCRRSEERRIGDERTDQVHAVIDRFAETAHRYIVGARQNCYGVVQRRHAAIHQVAEDLLEGWIRRWVILALVENRISFTRQPRGHQHALLGNMNHLAALQDHLCGRHGASDGVVRHAVVDDDVSVGPKPGAHRL